MEFHVFPLFLTQFEPDRYSGHPAKVTVLFVDAFDGGGATGGVSLGSVPHEGATFFNTGIETPFNGRGMCDCR
jgi:hypothetical protein